MLVAFVDLVSGCCWCGGLVQVLVGAEGGASVRREHCVSRPGGSGRGGIGAIRLGSMRLGQLLRQGRSMYMKCNNSNSFTSSSYSYTICAPTTHASLCKCKYVDTMTITMD